MPNIRSLGFILLLASTATFTALAGGPEKGELTVQVKGEPITSFDIKYNISQLMGEPVVSAIYCWHSPTLKTINPDATLWLKVTSADGKSWAYLKASPTVPAEGKWGMDTPGSPNWDKVIVKSYKGNTATAYWPAEDAKKFWKAGFTVTGATLSYSIKK